MYQIPFLQIIIQVHISILMKATFAQPKPLSVFTCITKLCIECNHFPFLYNRALEHNTLSGIQTACLVLHTMLGSFRHRVQFKNVSRFWLRNRESENIRSERDRWEDKIKTVGAVCGLDTAGCLYVQWQFVVYVVMNIRSL